MKNRYVLTGGLGNQLFQYAAAISIESKYCYQTELEICLGKPRSTMGVPDLQYFKLKNAIIRNTWSTVLNRVLGYSLRTSLEHPKSFLSVTLNNWIKRGLSVFSSLLMIRPVFVVSPKNLGWDPRFNVCDANCLVIGYFQSYKYATSDSSTKQTLSDLELENESVQVRRFRKLSLTDSPLIVHVRRGDYVNEASFGILSPEYYQSVIRKAYCTGLYEKIWLFSDDFYEAFKCIPEELKDRVLQINEIDNLPANTLQVMRYGKGYVIANSSYSWWGAFLSVNPDSQVHAPYPWFKGIPTPNELLPPAWIRHQSIFC